MLTVYLPVPEGLEGQKLKLLMLDRNGQLEAVPAERGRVNGLEVFYFQTNHVSQIGIYGAGPAEADQEVMELSVEMTDMSAPPAQKGFDFGILRPYLAGSLLILGTFFVLSGIRKSRR